LRAKGTKAAVADTAHHNQMLCATKATVLTAMVDDARGQSLAYAGQTFQLGGRSRVEINERCARPLLSED
jgi:hypothetical protein